MAIGDLVKEVLRQRAIQEKETGDLSVPRLSAKMTWEQRVARAQALKKRREYYAKQKIKKRLDMRRAEFLAFCAYREKPDLSVRAGLLYEEYVKLAKFPMNIQDFGRLARERWSVKRYGKRGGVTYLGVGLSEICPSLSAKT